MFFGKKEGAKIHDSVKDQKKAVLANEPPVLAELALAGLDCDQLPNTRGQFGHFYKNPIITNGINGTMIYFGKLISKKTGKKLLFHRLGSIPNALTDVETIDIYETMDETGNHWDILFVDMYHPRRSNFVPEDYQFEEYQSSGDRNNAYGTIRNSKYFPLDLVKTLIEDRNPRYIVVEKIIEISGLSGRQKIRPAEHEIKIESVMRLLRELKEEK